MKTLFWILVAWGLVLCALLWIDQSYGNEVVTKPVPVQAVNNQIKEDAYFDTYRIRAYIKRIRAEGKVPTFIDNPKWRDSFRDKNEADVLFFE